MHTSRIQTGFTLVELIMVIVITGIISSTVAIFLKTPIDEYVDIARRAEMTDIADTALRRMGRDIHTALPNSIRVNSSYLEFLPTVMGGRYRKAQTGDILDFTMADTGFDVIGILPIAPVTGQELVIYNTHTASVYTGANVATIAASSTTTNIVFTAKKFPFESPSQRFQIIAAPVTFACVGTTLWRYSGYTRQATQPIDISSPPLSTAANSAALATNVDCAASSFVYAAGVPQRNELVAITLKITLGGESISLYHEIHVNNVP